MRWVLGEMSVEGGLNEGRASEAEKTLVKRKWGVVVPGGGVEPPRPEGRRILSPLRLPIPPSRRLQPQYRTGVVLLPTRVTPKEGAIRQSVRAYFSTPADIPSPQATPRSLHQLANVYPKNAESNVGPRPLFDVTVYWPLIAFSPLVSASK